MIKDMCLEFSTISTRICSVVLCLAQPSLAKRAFWFLDIKPPSVIQSSNLLFNTVANSLYEVVNTAIGRRRQSNETGKLSLT